MERVSRSPFPSSPCGLWEELECSPWPRQAAAPGPCSSSSPGGEGRGGDTTQLPLSPLEPEQTLGGWRGLGSLGQVTGLAQSPAVQAWASPPLSPRQLCRASEGDAERGHRLEHGRRYDTFEVFLTIKGLPPPECTEFSLTSWNKGVRELSLIEHPFCPRKSTRKLRYHYHPSFTEEKTGALFYEAVMRNPGPSGQSESSGITVSG